jgi:acyl dehydratase
MKLAELDRLTGCELGVSEWIMVDQPMIDAFANLTDDHQYIHVDPARAAETQLGGTIAHGFLVLSLLPRMMTSAGLPLGDDMSVSLNYGMDRLRFVSPVRSGRKVRGRFVQASCQERRPGRYQRVLEATIEIEGAERPALIARWLLELA